MKKITIKSGWFRAAGNIYKWKNDYHIFGVGIAIEHLEKNDQIAINIMGEDYTLDCVKALHFINKYNSHKEVGKGKVVGVISRSLLVPVDDNEPAKPPTPKDPSTTRLF